ncbi:hypothetical protein [Bartonella henselae]|uniref:hypothetical protein n=1 Tax=Bartonella henselae TaxID=38323 RepID=UPI000FE13DDC|nr:hypothetical protein [Bartonella henselae]
MRMSPNKFNEFTQNVDQTTQQLKDDALLWSKEANAFVADHGAEGKKANSKITHLLAGDISKSSTDAITGGQLYTLNQTLATYFGGGAKYEDGKWTAPTFTVKTVKEDGKEEEKSYQNVAAALTGVGSSFTNIRNEITKEINKEIANVKGESLVKQDPKSKQITIGKEVAGTGINIANSSGQDRRLSGVKAAENDNDAVNKGQLDQGLKELSDNLQSDDSVVVHYDKKTDGNIDYTSVTLGKGKDSAAVALHNVANGKIASGSKDVVTGGQINKIGEDVAKILGGGAKFDDGSFTEPTYTVSNIDKDGHVKESQYHDAGSALVGLDTNIKNVNENVTNKFNEFTQNVDQTTQQLKDDALLWSKEANAFVADHGAEGKKANSKITHLLAGDISKSSTDAITGGQLYSLNQTLATYFGGGAKYEDGKWTAPTYTVKKFDSEGNATEESYNNVASAFEGFNSSLTNVHNEINNALSGVEGESLVKQDPESKQITIGKEVAGTGINIANSSGQDRRLSGVKAAENDNDAVNKGQLDQGLKELSDNLQSDDSVVVHYDKKTDGNIDYTSVTLGKGKDSAAVALHNVANGKIASGSKDVVTGGQINKIGEDVAKILGGGAKFDDGSFTEPTYTVSNIDKDGHVKESQYHDAGSALVGLDTNIKNVNENVTNKFNEFTQNVDQTTQQLKDDALLWSKEANAFVADHGAEGKKANSKITHLLAGDISKSSTDAITGGQLYTLNQTLATYFGGGAKYEDGKWTAPTYTVKKFNSDGTESTQEYQSVSEAFGGVNAAFTSFGDKVTNQITQQLGNQVTEQIKSEALSWSEVDKAYVARHGKGESRSNSKITFLANGLIGKDSTDAINGSQLYTISNALAAYFGEVQNIRTANG